jgi:glycosyltransferase involved in cell wall biosynthesis
VRILRVYHSGRDAAHRARERALAALGVDVTLVVPSHWPEGGSEERLSSEPFRIVELDVRRAGDVNRHIYADEEALSRLVNSLRPDVLDLHEEPVSLVARQWLRGAGALPVTMYTAQNVDKRFPPPFAQFEMAAYRRVDALYPCSRQAAAVARGKGFAGLVEVLPLGVDSTYSPGNQSATDPEIRLGLVGRLVPEKGVTDAIRMLAEVLRHRPARLVVIGTGPEEGPARALAQQLGVDAAVDFLPWQPLDELARLYRTLHVVLVPSRATHTWVEQFGRIILEGKASGAVVAGYRSGAIPEVASDAAVLVPEGAAAELAAGVRDLLGDPDRYAALRAAGLRRSSEASWSAVAARQAALYRRVASSGPLPRQSRAPAHVRRRAAAEEFGPVAELPGGNRPFALPVLRQGNGWTRATGRAIDAVTRLAGR